MAYGNFKNLLKRAGSDKVLRDEAYNIAKNPKYDEYQSGLTSMVYKSLDKKTSGTNTSGGDVKSDIMANQQLTEELHKTVFRNFKKRKVFLSFKDNICGADLANMHLISKLMSNFIDIYSKYTYVVSLKYRKDITISNAFQKILN